MSYNRGKNWKKKKTSLSKKEFTHKMIDKKLNSLFGEFDWKKVYSKPEEGVDRVEYFLESDKEYSKVFKNMLKNKKDITTFLKTLKRNEDKNYKRLYYNILDCYFYGPYSQLGNQSKWWYKEFHKWISEFQEYKKHDLDVFYRSMSKSEFLKQLEKGVKGMSWSTSLSNVLRFVNLSFDGMKSKEDMVIVGSVFDNSQFIDFTDREGRNPLGLLNEKEKEVWVKRNEKPLRTWVVGTYTYDDYINSCNYNEIFTPEVQEEFSNVMKKTNNFGNEWTKKICESVFFDLSDEKMSSNKLWMNDVPKLVRKMSKDKWFSSLNVQSILDGLKGWSDLYIKYNKENKYIDVQHGHSVNLNLV